MARIAHMATETLPLIFKIATEPWEFKQIHKLNYRTFVEEIPQHQPNAGQTLVDTFHDENTYIICIRGRELVGMVAIRANRPFSLDAKLPNLGASLPPAQSICEMRLLAVQPGCRNGKVFRGLMEKVEELCLVQGYDLAVISGTVRQQGLYIHLGFVPFGPLVGTPEALYQPMYLTLQGWQEKARTLKHPCSPSRRRVQPVNLLPGPVSVRPEVREAFCSPPTSHRSKEFLVHFERTKDHLCRMVEGRHVEILAGTGTLANDVVAAQLSLGTRRSLILSNGEFGERLVDHGRRFGLDFEVVETAWGEPIDYAEVAHVLERHSEIGWLWLVHCETSTGVLNNLSRVKALCRKHHVLLCVDCISSLGTVPVSLRDVYLASGVSGKGLGAFPGLALVWYNHTIRPQADKLPRYLDLGYYAVQNGIPFTTSSNLVYALEAAVQRHRTPECFEVTATLSTWLRHALRARGFRIVAPDSHASPAVISLALAEHLDSQQLGRELETRGFLLSYNSEYLVKRNWMQICLMGQCSQEEIAPLLDLLTALTAQPGSGAASS